MYCLLSAAPLFDALFATLHAVLRLERREHTKMIEVRLNALLLFQSRQFNITFILTGGSDRLGPGYSATAARHGCVVSRWERGLNAHPMACRYRPGNRPATTGTLCWFYTSYFRLQLGTVHPIAYMPMPSS